MIVMRCRIIVNNVEYQGREGKPTTEAKKLNFFYIKVRKQWGVPLPNVEPGLAGGDQDLGPDLLGKVRGVVVVHAPPLVLQLCHQVLAINLGNKIGTGNILQLESKTTKETPFFSTQNKVS